MGILLLEIFPEGPSNPILPSVTCPVVTYMMQFKEAWLALKANRTGTTVCRKYLHLSLTHIATDRNVWAHIPIPILSDVAVPTKYLEATRKTIRSKPVVDTPFTDRTPMVCTPSIYVIDGQ